MNNHRKKKTVYFVRHGQSNENILPVFQSVNAALSPRGIAQAQSVAERLSTVSFEALISSPVLRAKETAGYIAEKTGKTICFSDLFVERIKPSGIEGKSWYDEQAIKVWREWEQSLYTPGLRIGDGENYDDTIKRVDEALEYLEKREETVSVVVTHGYFLRAIVIRILMGDQLNGHIMKNFQQRASIENTAITVINYSNAYEEDFAWRLWTLNDHSHFAEK